MNLPKILNKKYLFHENLRFEQFSTYSKNKPFKTKNTKNLTRKKVIVFLWN